MINLKIPIYAGMIGFVLILITNILKQNSIFVIFFRSVFYGVLVFGLLLGIYFVLRKFLNIDFNINNAKPDEDADEDEEKGNVDILVGKDDLEEDYIKDDEKEIGEEELKNDENVIIENKKEENEDSPLDDFILKEEKMEKKGNLDNFDGRISELPEESKIFENENNIINDGYKDNNIDEVDDFSLQEDNFQQKENYNKKDSTKDFLKNKIGVDVSYDDLAKAIRTKMKRDED